MKRLLLFTILFHTAFLAIAQYDSWSKAVALTDSVNLNSNPDIFVGDSCTLMFYEKKSDSNSLSTIYYRDIENMGDEKLLFGDSLIEYQSPKVLGVWYDSRWIIYTSSRTGHSEIHGLSINNDGTFGKNLTLYETDHAIQLSKSDNYLLWESNGAIFTSRLLKQVDTLLLGNVVRLDSGNCLNPRSKESTIYYQKKEQDSLHIYYCELDSVPDYWSDPFPVDTTGNCLNMNVNLYSEGGWLDGEAQIIWEKQGRLFYYNKYMDTIQQVAISWRQDSLAYQPAIQTYTMPRGMDNYFVSFASTINGNREIFAFYHYFKNSQSKTECLSDNSMDNSFPNFYLGWRGPNSFFCEVYLLNIWETRTFSHGSYLNMAKKNIALCGSVEENGLKQQIVKAAPNPFTTNTTIKFYQTCNKPVSLIFLSISGKTIRHAVIQHPQFGWNSIIWQPGIDIPPGIYIIRLLQEGKSESIKVVKKASY